MGDSKIPTSSKSEGMRDAARQAKDLFPKNGAAFLAGSAVVLLAKAFANRTSNQRYSGTTIQPVFAPAEGTTCTRSSGISDPLLSKAKDRIRGLEVTAQTLGVGQEQSNPFWGDGFMISDTASELRGTASDLKKLATEYESALAERNANPTRENVDRARKSMKALMDELK
jgi:hypothetical protein